jgi:high affinity Mn2+ porin
MVCERTRAGIERARAKGTGVARSCLSDPDLNVLRSPDRHHVVARRLPRLVGACLVARVLFASATANAQAAPPAGHEDAAFDIMNLLAHSGLHDIHDESWNAYGQFTFISSYKAPFYAPYTNTNANGGVYSLLPDAEGSFTGTFTLFFGLRLWPGGEAHLVPEVIAERPLSKLKGIGGAIQNFELQKGGTETPQLYRSRTYLRQTIGFGGKPVEKTSDPMQLATVVDSRRLLLTAGNFTILDVFDRNSITWDPRQTFLNMAFITHASWDFPSDARGYSWGGTAELYWDDWALRIGRITPPQVPNDPTIDFQLDKHYGDEFELEHDHVLLGKAGAVRLLAYRNHVVTGRFDEAIAALQADPSKNANAATTACAGSYGSGNATAPDICWVRRPNVKVGIGINLEQHITDDIGVFFRGMVSDGQTEVDAYNPADRSVSFGTVAKGSAWRRPFDVTGVGFGMSWISQAHAQYLAMGGIDGFIGDGHLRQAAEGVVDAFYSVNLLKAIWLSADYQYLWNPGFNADRGPVNILGGRVHAEF